MEPLAVAADRFINSSPGIWVFDDEARNPGCANAQALEFIPSLIPDPIDPPYSCPQPSKFVIEKRSTTKPCGQVSACPNPRGGYGFFIHAMPIGWSGVISEIMFFNMNGTWEMMGQFRAEVDTTRPNWLRIGQGQGAVFKRTTGLPGTCENL